jgi:nicotinamidase/pyrazinamidase
VTQALIVVDMQNDFMPGGALGVKGAFEIVKPILELMPKFSHCIATLDWHPKNHCSFAATHPGKKVGETIQIRSQDQRLWPVHCVQNTHGADFTPGFSKDQFDAIFHKGTDPSIDGYSAFYDNAHEKSTGLTAYLHKHGITQVVLVGLAFDYCVFYSALDARRDGFEAAVIPTLSRSIDNSPAEQKKILEALQLQGVAFQP